MKLILPAPSAEPTDEQTREAIEFIEHNTERKCGECQACCTALAIDDPELKKQPGVRCQHLCAAGCSIYATKPERCTTYYCWWRTGIQPDWIREEERPDKCGLIFELRPKSEVAEVTGTPVIQATEVWRGAGKQYRGEKIIKRLSRHAIVMVVDLVAGTRYLVGPPDAMTILSRYIVMLGEEGRPQQ